MAMVLRNTAGATTSRRAARLATARRHARVAQVVRASETEESAPPAADPAEEKEGFFLDNDRKGLDRMDPALAEKYAVKNSGEAECKACSYVYLPKNGDPEYPIMKGTGFDELPEDWCCPSCGAEKQFFRSRETQVAGFAANQGYGFGTNSLEEGQKSVLIYGSLAAFFGLFLAGYLLD
eukprot:CAMPEP_0183803558 /NCGR_PEP_ID=MMETSP0803_2-20130417/33298_1 /TAXON_ID=195967 /ORGANISM="Crustomastix stigmata, Strain CCMP3273" /LENGTH=178 /DNA_ID=CAMNT_0026048299 /DNA_START=19 /DNA_END=555 /DNA_ORIENTATION=+